MRTAVKQSDNSEHYQIQQGNEDSSKTKATNLTLDKWIETFHKPVIKDENGVNEAKQYEVNNCRSLSEHREQSVYACLNELIQHMTKEYVLRVFLNSIVIISSTISRGGVHIIRCTLYLHMCTEVYGPINLTTFYTMIIAVLVLHQ